MLHPLRYKLNKTWTLNYYSLPQPSLSSYLHPFLPPSLPPSLPLTPSSSDPPSSVSSIPSYLPSSLPLSLSLPLPPILPPLSLRHTISIPFSLFFPTLLCSSTPLFLHVFARHSFFGTHSLPHLLPPFLPPSLPAPSLPPLSPHLSLSSSDSTSSVSASHYIYPVFPILSHSSLYPSSSTFSPATRFLTIPSFSLSRTWIRSWLFAHIYMNVEAIYAIQSNCVIPAMLHWHYHSLTQTIQSVNWC